MDHPRAGPGHRDVTSLKPASLSAALLRLVDELEATGGWLGALEHGAEPVVLATCGEVRPLPERGLGPTGNLQTGCPFALRLLADEPSLLCGELRLDTRRALVALFAGGEARRLSEIAVGTVDAVQRLLASAAVQLREAGPSRRVLPPGPPKLNLPSQHLPGSSPAMRALYRQVQIAAAGASPVLICGETGVGKEHVARALHLTSKRRAGRFVAINCAAIPAELLEAEMFGIGEGVASGVQRREGCFQQAEGGTLLLDEIGELEPSLQAKLLRVLQEREVRPVGGKPHAVDVQVVATTNADLERQLEIGRLRADLYYRLAGQVLRVPPLRARREDIAPLLYHFLERFAVEAGKPALGVRMRAFQALVAYSWPGNVRELEHEVRRLVEISREGEPISLELLSPKLRRGSAGVDPGPEGSLVIEEHVRRLERRLIEEAFRRAGSLSAAARLLGVSRNGLKMKCRRLGIER